MTQNIIPYVVIFSFVVLTALLSGFFIAEKGSQERTFGKQFTESDLEGSTGTIKQVVVACDKTTIVVPDLLADNFIPWNITEFKDVNEETFRVTFWARESATGEVHVITQSHVKNGVTCILSVSKDINNLQPSESVEENDRKPSVSDSVIQTT